MKHLCLVIAALLLALCALSGAYADQPGELHVTGEPGLEIFIDGEPVGRTQGNVFVLVLLECILCLQRLQF